PIPSSLCSPLPLFVCRYCAPRVLHSFPTRRSSDLQLPVRDTRRVGRGLELDQEHGQHRVDLAPGEVDRVRHRSRQCLEHGEHQSDRKSTRLNSSHVKISYAVFCLKKKKRPCTAKYQ